MNHWPPRIKQTQLDRWVEKEKELQAVEQFLDVLQGDGLLRPGVTTACLMPRLYASYGIDYHAVQQEVARVGRGAAEFHAAHCEEARP